MWNEAEIDWVFSRTAQVIKSLGADA